MKAAVITFPGSNCDDDCVYTLSKLAGFQVDTLWHKDSPDLTEYDLVVLPGGFSYGDYLRCGAMAGLSPIMDSVRAYASKGKLLLGICNGFQILCEAGLLPGALARNKSLTFICNDVFIRTEDTASPWTNAISKGEVLKIPIAHGDGRYVVTEEEHKQMAANGQVLFTYTDAAGKAVESANPNGSVHSIAGVCNATKNVFGLMPHPERASDLRSKQGMKIFEGVLKHLKGGVA